MRDVLAKKPKMFVKLNLTTSVQQNLSAAFTSTSAGLLHSFIVYDEIFRCLFVCLSGLTTLENKGDKIELFKILNGYENIVLIFFQKARQVK